MKKFVFRAALSIAFLTGIACVVYKEDAESRVIHELNDAAARLRDRETRLRAAEECSYISTATPFVMSTIQAEISMSEHADSRPTCVADVCSQCYGIRQVHRFCEGHK